MHNTLTLMVVLAALGCEPAAQNVDTSAPSGASTGDTTGTAQVADTGGVTLALDKTAYAPGGRAVMTITSQRTDTLGYNPCGNRAVERETANGWVVHPEPNRMCTMELRLLKPGETQSAPTDVPADVTPGTYRIVLTLRQEHADSAPAAGTVVSAVSAPFRVPGP